MAIFDELFKPGVAQSPLLQRVYRSINGNQSVLNAYIVDDFDDVGDIDRIIGHATAQYKQHHPLVKTAFKNPPLNFESRFGTRQMPSFFYASKSPKTCLFEKAFYLLKYFDDAHSDKLNQTISLTVSVFSVGLHTNGALDLTSSYFHDVNDLVTDKSNYDFTQKIGQWALANDYDVIVFNSARHTNGVNYAVAKLDVIKPNTIKPASEVNFLVNKESATFEYKDNLYLFSSK